MAKERGLSKRNMFALKCLADPLSGTWQKQKESGIKAGMPENGAAEQMSRLLRKNNVKLIMDELEDKYYIESRATSIKEVTLHYINLRDLASVAGQYQAAINANTKLAEMGGLLKTRAVIEVEAVETPLDGATDAERAAYRQAAEVLKLALSESDTPPERARSVASFIPDDVVLETPVGTNDEQPFEQPEIPERVPAGLVGRGTGKPSHSQSEWK